MIAKGWWVCGYGHVFFWGDEDWHEEMSQPEGAPCYCNCEISPDEFCGDSCHLWGPYETFIAAEEGKAEPSIKDELRSYPR